MGLLEKLLKPKSREQFARTMLHTMRKKNPAAKAEYNPADFSIVRTPGGTTFLSNAYDEYRRCPALKRGKLIAFYAALKPPSETLVPTAFAEAATHLLPRVRDRFSHEAMRFMKSPDGKGPDVAYELLNEHLTVELVYDTPESMMLVPRKSLEEWGVSFETAMKTARDNLWKISNENWRQPVPGLHVAPWRDFHGASRLFLHDLVWQLPVKGDHVAMVPNRNCLFVAGDQDDDALLGMARLAETQFNEPRFMTAIAFRLNGNRWETFLPPRSSAAHTQFRELQTRSIGQLYHEQTSLLERHFKERGDANPSFVASFIGTKGPAGGLVTASSWAEDVHTLLPETDCYAIGAMKNGKAEHLGFLERDVIFREFRDLLQPTDYYPPRWKTSGFPSKERLAAMILHKTPTARGDTPATDHPAPAN